MASDAVCAAAAPQSVDEVESAFQGALEALHRLLLLQEQLNTTLRQVKGGGSQRHTWMHKKKDDV